MDSEYTITYLGYLKLEYERMLKEMFKIDLSYNELEVMNIIKIIKNTGNNFGKVIKLTNYSNSSEMEDCPSKYKNSLHKQECCSAIKYYLANLPVDVFKHCYNNGVLDLIRIAYGKYSNITYDPYHNYMPIRDFYHYPHFYNSFDKFVLYYNTVQNSGEKSLIDFEYALINLVIFSNSDDEVLKILQMIETNKLREIIERTYVIKFVQSHFSKALKVLFTRFIMSEIEKQGLINLAFLKADDNYFGELKSILEYNECPSLPYVVNNAKNQAEFIRKLYQVFKQKSSFVSYDYGFEIKINDLFEYVQQHFETIKEYPDILCLTINVCGNIIFIDENNLYIKDYYVAALENPFFLLTEKVNKDAASLFRKALKKALVEKEDLYSIILKDYKFILNKQLFNALPAYVKRDLDLWLKLFHEKLKTVDHTSNILSSFPSPLRNNIDFIKKILQSFEITDDLEQLTIEELKEKLYNHIANNNPHKK